MTVEGVQVKKGTSSVIRNTSLSLIDLDTPENELVFKLTKMPSNGKSMGRKLGMCQTPRFFNI